jgi:hypothetical protein
MKYRIPTQIPKNRYPMSIEDDQGGFNIMVKMFENSFNHSLEENHHKLNIYDGAKFFLHSPFEMFLKDSPNHRTIPGYSMLVYVNPFKMSIDGTLESYEPQRFVDPLKTLP